jgi:DNA-directed RNA polymerase specialized sigma24 family protein
MIEACQGLLDKLEDDTQREVAIWKLEGYTNKEIAEKVDRNERSVERKLKLIRKRWSEQSVVG